MANEDKHQDIAPDAEMKIDEGTASGQLSDTAGGDADVPSGAAGPDLVMPDDQGDGADDRHVNRDGPNDRANHGKGAESRQEKLR